MQLELKASMCESSMKLMPSWKFLKVVKLGKSKRISTKSYINFLFLLLNLLVSSDKVEDLKAIDVVVNFSHETFHEDNFRQTDAKVAKLGGKSLQFTKIVELHSWRGI
jgi:hypothetical protein